eukprot:4655741-Pyramimonas_sp.AAC.1
MPAMRGVSAAECRARAGIWAARCATGPTPYRWRGAGRRQRKGQPSREHSRGRGPGGSDARARGPPTEAQRGA